MTTNAKTKAYQVEQQDKLHKLRSEIKKGLEDVKHGRVGSPARAFAEVDKLLRENNVAAPRRDKWQRENAEAIAADNDLVAKPRTSPRQKK
jgi:hypothetical protein